MSIYWIFLTNRTYIYFNFYHYLYSDSIYIPELHQFATSQHSHLLKQYVCAVVQSLQIYLSGQFGMLRNNDTDGVLDCEACGWIPLSSCTGEQLCCRNATKMKQLNRA